MAVKRVVSTAFWTDGKVDEFSPEDKYFLLYLLTNPFTKQLGIYEISIKQAAFQLGYSIDSFNVLLERFENKYKMILFSKETSEVAILNFLCHSIMKGGKPVEDCLMQDIAGVKNKKLINAVFLHIRKRSDWGKLNVTVKKIVEGYLDRNGLFNENDNDNENDNENDKENDNENDRTRDESPHDSQNELYIAIVEHLNLRAGTSYRPSSKKTRSCIHARLEEGFKLDDFKKVIDKKADEWIGTEYEPYLRPETLFGTKFESYLNAKVIKPKAGQQGNKNPYPNVNQDDLDEVF